MDDLYEWPPASSAIGQELTGRNHPLARATIRWSASTLVAVLAIALSAPTMLNDFWLFFGFAFLFVAPPLGLAVMIATFIFRRRNSARLRGADAFSAAGTLNCITQHGTRSAAEFTMWRQTVLFVAHTALISIAIWDGVVHFWPSAGWGIRYFDPTLATAPLGLIVLCTVPLWVFGRSVSCGEQVALATRTNAWKLILVHRILAWIVGIAGCSLSVVVLGVSAFMIVSA